MRALARPSGGADYHARPAGHWIDGQIATPMSMYPEYRLTRSSFGLDVLGTLVVEVEADSGEVGVGLSTGGVPGCWIVEKHLSRFIEGQEAADIELIWDQMWRSTLFYGRRGLVVNAISAVDLALWDLLGKLRAEPVYRLLGGPVQDELRFYATGPRPDLAEQLGFIGGKLPLVHGPAEGEAGLRQNVQLGAQMRSRVGGDFFLAYDCWMALDVEYSLRLIADLTDQGFQWVEEPLPPDDYWGYAELRRRAPRDVLIATGEHEATRSGFRLLIDMGCCDLIQPDLGWCGGLTELLKIAEYADARGIQVVPHGSSVYAYHFLASRREVRFAEFLMLSPAADSVVPIFAPLLAGEPVPEQGRLQVSALDRPGFGVTLDTAQDLDRPFPR